VKPLCLGRVPFRSPRRKPLSFRMVSVLQCVAVCSSLPSAAVSYCVCVCLSLSHTHTIPFEKKTFSCRRCNTLQCTVTHCNTLQRIATCCHMLQHAATRCNTLIEHVNTTSSSHHISHFSKTLLQSCVTVCCSNVLRRSAVVCCGVLP